MAKIVCKFGGTSLADSTQMKKVRDILLSNDERQIAVLSAPGKRFTDDIKITDLLYASLKDDDAFEKVVRRFFSLERDLNVSHSASTYLITNKDYLKTNKDLMASRGEYCSALIFSEYIGFEFQDASEIILLNEDGTINNETYDKITEKLKNNKRYIIPGFYGTLKDNSIKTFSRGGSDITGAILAKGYGASLYENWSDVSGVMAANPRIIDNPKIISELSYDEIELLSSYGAEVFHHDAIAPVKDIIPINIKNTNAPKDNGTMIVSNKNHKTLPLLSISVKDNTVYVLGNNTIIESVITKKEDISNKVKELYSKYFN